jgi:hypothetical protein
VDVTTLVGAFHEYTNAPKKRQPMLAFLPLCLQDSDLCAHHFAQDICCCDVSAGSLSKRRGRYQNDRVSHWKQVCVAFLVAVCNCFAVVISFPNIILFISVGFQRL